jgi:alkylhydroperoxidase family enzyme
MTADVDEARTGEILGKPPRIAPADRAAVGAEVQALTSRVRGEVVGDYALLPIEVLPEIMFTMSRHGELWDRILALSTQVQGPRGVLAPRDRQIAILRTAWLLQAPYEWGEHVKHGKKIGLTAPEIEGIIEGSGAALWSDEDRAVLRAAEETRDDCYVSDATWAALAARMDERQLIELLVVIGHFTNLASLQNSLRLRPERGNLGLATR